MFRRIELFDEMSEEGYRNFIQAMRQRIDDPDYNIEKEFPRFWKSGLMGFGNPLEQILYAYLELPCPKKAISS